MHLATSVPRSVQQASLESMHLLELELELVWVTAQLASACWWASRALVHGCAAVLCVW